MKRHSPAADRNKEAIANVLARVLPKAGTVLEIASGSGQHVAHFAARFSDLAWQPSDREDEAFDSIAEWTHGLDNVRAPLRIDVTDKTWPLDRANAIVCANMIHIAPWDACLGLLDGASRVLGAGAPFVLYGPFMIDGKHTAESNAAFDLDLRARNVAWGVRDLEVVRDEAASRGLDFVERVDMPANNFTLVFRRRDE